MPSTGAGAGAGAGAGVGVGVGVGVGAGALSVDDAVLAGASTIAVGVEDGAPRGFVSSGTTGTEVRLRALGGLSATEVALWSSA